MRKSRGRGERSRDRRRGEKAKERIRENERNVNREIYKERHGCARVKEKKREEHCM